MCLSYSGGELGGVTATYGVFTEDGSATVNGGGKSYTCIVIYIFMQTPNITSILIY